LFVEKALGKNEPRKKDPHKTEIATLRITHGCYLTSFFRTRENTAKNQAILLISLKSNIDPTQEPLLDAAALISSIS
jgi:hypothetical protein